jgi:hypothetical protein
MKARQLMKILAEHPGLCVLVEDRDEDYPFVELEMASMEKVLINGDRIEIDNGQDPDEHQVSAKAIVLRLPRI